MARTSHTIVLEHGDHIWVKVNQHTAIVELLMGNQEIRILFNPEDAEQLQRQLREAAGKLVEMVDDT